MKDLTMTNQNMKKVYQESLILKEKFKLLKSENLKLKRKLDKIKKLVLTN